MCPHISECSVGVDMSVHGLHSGVKGVQYRTREPTMFDLHLRDMHRYVNALHGTPVGLQRPKVRLSTYTYKFKPRPESTDSPGTANIRSVHPCRRTPTPSLRRRALP